MSGRGRKGVQPRDFERCDPPFASPSISLPCRQSPTHVASPAESTALMVSRLLPAPHPRRAASYLRLFSRATEPAADPSDLAEASGDGVAAAPWPPGVPLPDPGAAPGLGMDRIGGRPAGPGEGRVKAATPAPRRGGTGSGGLSSPPGLPSAGAPFAAEAGGVPGSWAPSSRASSFASPSRM